MTRRWLLAAALLVPAPAAAQVPGRTPPGPYVVDLRGSTSDLPTDVAFYPALGSTIAVASRGLGFEAGGHVYLFPLGPARVGIGASYSTIEGGSPDASLSMRLLAPQISFNFGSGNGWSYLSGGVGIARVEAEVTGDAAGRAETGSLMSINFGGGARWFLQEHFGIGFDVRFHRVAAGQIEGTAAATPGLTLMTASVGISLK